MGKFPVFYNIDDIVPLSGHGPHPTHSFNYTLDLMNSDPMLSSLKGFVDTTQHINLGGVM